MKKTLLAGTLFLAIVGSTHAIAQTTRVDQNVTLNKAYVSGDWIVESIYANGHIFGCEARLSKHSLSGIPDSISLIKRHLVYLQISATDLPGVDPLRTHLAYFQLNGDRLDKSLIPNNKIPTFILILKDQEFDRLIARKASSIYVDGQKFNLDFSATAKVFAELRLCH